jgi:hypothetical protein
MSATEIIEQFKTLPAAERAQVARFFAALACGTPDD